jgi:hypothetical protein
MAREFGKRTDDELGKDIYDKPVDPVDDLRARYLKPGSGGEQETSPEVEEGERPAPLKGLAADEAAGELLYPPVPDEQDSIRDTDGDVLYAGAAGVDRPTLAARHSNDLRQANLRDFDFTSPGISSLEGGHLEGADARGARFPESMRNASIAGMIVDEDTVIGDTDWGGVTLDVETFNRLRVCRGFDKALKHGLYKPRPA